MNIKWTDKITNKELWRITKQKPIEIQIKRRKWNWIGHTLHKEAGAIEKIVNVYLPSLRMKVPDHVYVLGHSYTCHTLIKYNRYA
jgi:hypothetical protein